MRTLSEFQIDGAEIEKARKKKLHVMPFGLGRTFLLEECKDWDGK